MKQVFDSMDFFLWQDERFGLHMRNFPKGLTNLDKFGEEKSEYIINSMRYLVLEFFP